MDGQRRRKARPVKTVTAPIVQIMPDNRARLDPSCVSDIACYLLTQRQQYERASQMTLSGLAGVLRERRKGQIAWARAMCEAYDTIVRQLPETVERRALESVRDQWSRGASEGAPNGD